MTITELFPTLRSLSRVDKLKVMQFLITELAEEEEPMLEQGRTISVNTDEFITTEKTTKPLHRVTEIQVISIAN